MSFGFTHKERYESLANAVKRADEKMLKNKENYRKENGIYTISQIINDLKEEIDSIEKTLIDDILDSSINSAEKKDIIQLSISNLLKIFIKN